MSTATAKKQPRLTTKSTRVVKQEVPHIGTEVYTLPELASFLRVPEAAVLELVQANAFSGQQIRGEWRFLKQAVVEWLMPQNGVANHSPSSNGHAKVERPKPGTKEAILQSFGVFKDDDDLEEQLALLRSYRKERRA